jgi:hypothetical protein
MSKVDLEEGLYHWRCQADLVHYRSYLVVDDGFRNWGLPDRLANLVSLPEAAEGLAHLQPYLLG